MEVISSLCSLMVNVSSPRHTHSQGEAGSDGC